MCFFRSILGPLTGKKVLVTAGPTREFIDPVRFISNPSSGKMGISMAEAARNLGGDVILLHGPIPMSVPERLQSENFTSADELFELVQKHADADVVIKAAAVSDFKPVLHSDQKTKKESAVLSVELKRNPDILAWLGENKREGQILIGFAMETENLIQNAKKKLKNKNLDWICANSISASDSGFESNHNTVHLLGPHSDDKYTGSKDVVAMEIMNKIFKS